MCDSNTFGPKWLNENIINDGVSIHLVGQSYPDSDSKKGDDLFLGDPNYNLSNFILNDISLNIFLETVMDNNGNDFFSDNTSPFLTFFIQYNITRENNGFARSTFYNFLSSSSNEFDENSYNKLQSAINNNIPKNASSNRLVTCDFLYRRDIIQNFITNLLCDPRNRLCIGSPLLLPYMLDLSNVIADDIVKESAENEFFQLISQLSAKYGENDNQYRFPLVPNSIKVQIPNGLQLGSIFNTDNTGYVLNNRIDISLNTAFIPAKIVVPPGVYQILATIPVEIPNGTEIKNYSGLIYESLNYDYETIDLSLHPDIIIGNTITSLSSELNNTGNLIIKKIQLVDQVAVTNITAYFLTLKFNFTGNATLLCDSASGFKFQAMKIA